MKITEFINDFKTKKIANSKLNEHAVEDYIKETLEVKDYIPFQTKKEIVTEIINHSTTNENGYVIVSSIDQFISFVVVMLATYTNLEIDDPYESYDILTQEGLLSVIIESFRNEYDACDILLKLALNDKLQTNNTAAIIAEFLNKVEHMLESVNNNLTDKIENLNLDTLLNNTENIADILQLLNKE